MNIVWKKPDRTIAVTSIADNCDIESSLHANQLLARGDVPSDWEPVAFDADIDSNEFDAARVWDTNIYIDIGLAKEVTNGYLRVARTNIFLRLDADFIRSLEVRDVGEQNRIAVEKQRLRDITKQVDTCSTLDEMRFLIAGMR